MRSYFRAALLVMAAISMGADAKAGTIVAPVSATANVPIWIGSLRNLINQSGLWNGYTSGVTDFDSYIASEPTHDGLFTTWYGMQGSLILDMGAAIQVESFALWNRAIPNHGMRDFDLRACPDSACLTTTLLGSFTAANDVGDADDAGVQVFAFSATTTQYLRVDMLNTYRPVSMLSLSAHEMAFERSATVTDTPEPASALLLAGGLLALTARRRYGAG